MAICFGLIGFIPGLTHVIVPFLLIYGISYFFTEFGPNVTTFLIPTEVFGVGERTTGHGIAAGSGQAGRVPRRLPLPRAQLGARPGRGADLLLRCWGWPGRC